MAHFIAYASHSIVDQFCSVGLNVREATAIIFFFPLSASCIKIAPHTTSLASVVSVNSREKSGNEMTDGEESRFLIFSKALSVLSVQANGLLTLLSSCMGLIRLENMLYLICLCRRVPRNCLIHTKRPMRLCNSFFDVGGFISLMTQTYSGSALNPLLFTMRPRNFTSDEGTFVRVQLKSEFAEGNEELFESEYVFIECLSVDQGVVYVGRYVVTRCNSGQGFHYVAWKDLSSWNKTECLACVLVASVSLRKRCFVAISLVDLDLPVAAAEIKWCEVFVSFANPVEQMVDPRHCVWVEIDKNLVETSFEIGDQADQPVFLAYGKYRAIEASGIGATFNDTLSSHAFYFGIDVCFLDLGNWVLFLGARLTVSIRTAWINVPLMPFSVPIISV